MSDFTLGQKVVFTHPLKRVGTWDEERRRAGKAWQPSRMERLRPEEVREGIIIGKRTLANGLTQWEDEVGTIFMPTEHFQAYLIATALHLKPSVVRVENVRRAPLVWASVPQDEPLFSARKVRETGHTAWLEGAAAGASVDMGFIPSDALTRDLPERLAEQFRGLNPYTLTED